MAEFTGQIPHFLESFLSSPETAIPKGAQWILTFDNIPVDLIKRVGGGFYEPRKWEIDAAINATALNENVMETKGCLFVNAVQLPNESIGTNFEGVDQCGFLKTTVGQGRTPYEAVDIVFIDTNISFADNVIRPWVITTGHLGMLAREGNLNYRTNINLYKITTLAKDETKPLITQKIIFHGACPISVSGEEWNYTPIVSPSFRNTTFSYWYYQVEGVGASR